MYMLGRDPKPNLLKQGQPTPFLLQPQQKQKKMCIHKGETKVAKIIDR